MFISSLREAKIFTEDISRRPQKMILLLVSLMKVWGLQFLDGCPDPPLGDFNPQQRFHDPIRNWDNSPEIKK
jgi:hypothetical protein